MSGHLYTGRDDLEIEAILHLQITDTTTPSIIAIDQRKMGKSGSHRSTRMSFRFGDSTGWMFGGALVVPKFRFRLRFR